MDSDRKIIVGIDFGTTYSGVAWAETKRPDRQSTITTWPISKAAREGESSDKVPTKICYANGEFEWGFQIPSSAPSDEVLEWFKLDLDPSLQAAGNPMSAAVAKSGHPVENIVSDYLSAIIEHLRYILREKLGEGIVRSVPLEFVVTVPAIWSDLAKEKTRQACLLATTLNGASSGSSVRRADPRITLVSEPEAAAIYTLRGLDPHGLRVGDTFVVCDAGGGTVDLISYTISALQPVLEVREAAPGSGALCGSTFLNRRFASFMTAKLGSQEGWDDEMLAEAVDYFEKTVKRKFTMQAPPNEIYHIPVGGLPNNRELGVNRGKFALKATDLQVIFEPVILQIIQLVRDQIAATRVPVRAVLLVGGFGASTYLKERLRNALHESVQVLQPPKAWSAVVEGAVMKGLAQNSPNSSTSVRVKNRVARKHYGVELSMEYNEALHWNMDKRWDGLDGKWRVTAMHWLIKRGDAVSENEPFYTPLDWTGKVSEGRVKNVRLRFYCDESRRPAPVARDSSVKLLCVLDADLSRIPESELDRRRGADGFYYYQVNCMIEVIYHSASTEYALIHKNKRYSTVTAEYV